MKYFYVWWLICYTSLVEMPEYLPLAFISPVASSDLACYLYNDHWFKHIPSYEIGLKIRSHYRFGRQKWLWKVGQTVILNYNGKFISLASIAVRFQIWKVVFSFSVVPAHFPDTAIRGFSYLRLYFHLSFRKAACTRQGSFYWTWLRELGNQYSSRSAVMRSNATERSP